MLPATFGALFAASPDAILIADEHGHYLEANPAALAMLGYTREEVLGLSVGDVVAPGPIWAAEEYARFLQEGQWQGEVELRTQDGRLVPAEARAVVVPGAGRSLYASFLRDITDRKRGEDELRLSEARFRTAFDDAAIGMALIALDGSFFRVNAAFCELTGYTAAELLTRSFQDITHPDDVAADQEQAEHLLSGEIGTSRVETRYLRKDGEVVWVRGVASLVHDEHGAPLHFIGQVEDITGRKRAEEDLQKALTDAQDANRAKGDFLDLMSHELRTPLQAVLGYAEFLLNRPKHSLTDEQREDIDAIHRAGSRMLALINQLLDLSRMDADRFDLAVEPVDLTQIIETVRQDVAPQAAAKALVLEMVVPPSLPTVLGDAERVRQILLNLVGNAVKFTDAGSVRLRVAALPEDGVEIVVRDTGVGIAADALVHIFEPFYQVEGGMTRHQGGSGLGLAIASQLAQRMGGSLSVSSEPELGTTFWLYLPAG